MGSRIRNPRKSPKIRAKIPQNWAQNRCQNSPKSGAKFRVKITPKKSFLSRPPRPPQIWPPGRNFPPGPRKSSPLGERELFLGKKRPDFRPPAPGPKIGPGRLGPPGPPGRPGRPRRARPPSPSPPGFPPFFPRSLV